MDKESARQIAKSFVLTHKERFKTRTEARETDFQKFHSIVGPGIIFSDAEIVQMYLTELLMKFKYDE